MNLFRKKTVAGIIEQTSNDKSPLARHLGVKDLTALGIAAIIGAGIFSTIGNASSNGGPGVVLLFIFTAIACSFAAFAYAEFASMVPVSGSAYTYSYVAFGELMAWIIGCALIMEYAIGNITVAISWSDYFTGLLASGGVDLPAWMTMDFISAMNGHSKATLLMASGKTFEHLEANLQIAWNAWEHAPRIGALHLVADLPALLIIIFITWLVYRGIRESKNAGNTMVIIKISIVLLVIIVGSFFVNMENWDPFLPNGISGVLKGVSAVFFAYIGFDAISTTAEECKNPQRDLPKAMMWSIIICTILYLSISLVLTGMVSYSDLAVGDPLAFVFQKVNLNWLSGIIAVSAIVAMASVLLVFQLGQPRIWMSMSRDGLLPKKFSRIHPKYKTPSFATIVTGFAVAIPALFMNLTMVTDLCSIGTLFAFVLVCAGVLRLETMKDVPRGKFRTPYINSRFIMPLLLLTAVVLSVNYNRENTFSFLQNSAKQVEASELTGRLSVQELSAAREYIVANDNDEYIAQLSDFDSYVQSLDEAKYAGFLERVNIPAEKKIVSGWSLFKNKIPTWIFLITTLVLTVLAMRHKLSLIPLLGLVSCLYMMSELGLTNWIVFMVSQVIGLVFYFTYSYKNSRLNKLAEVV